MNFSLSSKNDNVTINTMDINFAVNNFQQQSSTNNDADIFKKKSQVNLLGPDKTLTAKSKHLPVNILP